MVLVHPYVRYVCVSTGRKKVEVLLQQMFEGEINPEDDGGEDAYLSKKRTLTLDTVT